jgi:hypothetical protein
MSRGTTGQPAFPPMDIAKLWPLLEMRRLLVAEDGDRLSKIGRFDSRPAGRDHGGIMRRRTD